VQIRKLSNRRDFLCMAAVGVTSAVLLAACAPSAPATPTAAPKPATTSASSSQATAVSNGQTSPAPSAASAPVGVPTAIRLHARKG